MQKQTYGTLREATQLTTNRQRSRSPVIHGSMESARDSLLDGIDPWGVYDCLILWVCLCPLFEFTAMTTLCVMWKASHGFHSKWENRRFQCFTMDLVENTRRLQWRIQDGFTMENRWQRVWNKMRWTWRKNSADLNIRRFSIFKGKKWRTQWLRFIVLKRGT